MILQKKKISLLLLFFAMIFFFFISSKPVFAQITPVIYQNYFRWYVNEDSVDVGDPWPTGPTDLSENEAIGLANVPPKLSNPLRLRMSLYLDPEGIGLGPGQGRFNLEWGQKESGSCSAVSVWTQVVAPSLCGVNTWCGYDNPSFADGSIFKSPVLSVTDVPQTYEEQNFGINVTPIAPGQDAEWDWAIVNNNAQANTDYCFRMVNWTGVPLNDYYYYPELTTEAITVSGSLVTIASPDPDGQTVVIKVNGSDKCNGTDLCTAETAGGGIWTISNLDIDAADDVLTVFVDDETPQGILITKAADTTSNILGLAIVENILTIQHEGGTAVTNTDLGQYDKDDDADIHFTSNSGTLSVDNDTSIKITDGKTFVPGGTVTTAPGGGGDIIIGMGSVFIAGGDISVGGSWDSGGSFLHNNYAVDFTATEEGKTINPGLSLNFYDVNFAGEGGGWSFLMPVWIDNDLSVTAGTLSGDQDLQILGGDAIGDGIINFTNGTFILDGDGNFGGNNAWTFYSLKFGDGGGEETTTASGSGSITVRDVLTVSPNQTLNAGSKNYVLTAESMILDPLVVNGTLIPSSSTFIYSGIAANVTPITYNNLTFEAGMYFLIGETTLNGNMHLAGGNLQQGATMNVAGDWTIDMGSTFASMGTINFTAISTGKTITSSDQSFFYVVFNGEGGSWLLQDALISNNGLDITYGELDANDQDITILNGDLLIQGDGVFTKGTGTFYFQTGGSNWIDLTAAKQDMGNVVLQGGPQTVIIANSAKATKINVGLAQTLVMNPGDNTLTITGSGLGEEKPFYFGIAALFDPGQSTVEYTGSSDTTVTREEGWIYYNLEINGTGPFTFGYGPIPITDAINNNLIVTSGTFELRAGTTAVANDISITGELIATSLNIEVGGSWTNAGTFTNGGGGTVTFVSGERETMIAGSSPFNNLVFNGSGVWTLQDTSLDVDGNFDLTSGILDQGTNPDIDINVAGNFTIEDGTIFAKGSGTGKIVFDGDDQQLTDNSAVKQNLGNIHIGTSPDSSYLCTDTVADDLTVNGGDLFYTNGFDLDITNDINIDGTLDATASPTSPPCGSEGDATIINLEQNWLVGASGTFIAGISTVIFDGAQNSDINVDTLSNAFFRLTLAKDSGETVTITNSNIDIDSNLTIGASSVFDVGSDFDINIGGSWANSGTFTCQQGTVTFDSADTGETIDSGGDNFYDIVFNHASGGWTIQTNNLTATNFTITNANTFVLDSGRTTTVTGTFTNSVGGANTTWTGSTLYLNGTSHTINTKTIGGDLYATLQVGASTDIRMWQSGASTFIIDSTSSLYSMDNVDLVGPGTPQDGELYIYGDYHTIGDDVDYWSFATDFDGSSLIPGVSARQAKIYLKIDDQVDSATQPSVTIDGGGTLEVIGGGAASNDITIVGQGASALWDFSCSGACTVQESTWNYLNLKAGTLTVYNTTLNNEDTPDAGATLNVDWYLGDSVVDRITLAAIDTGDNDITISENTDTPASTVFVWSGSDWSAGAISQTTGTGADGKIPQPGTNRAIKIREYARTSGGYIYYKYNLHIAWQGATYGEYDYFNGYGNKYIISTLAPEISSTDNCISESWQRNDIDAQNVPAQAIDEPPTNGTWYNGMLSGLSITIDDYSIEFGSLTPGGDPTNQTNTITVTTSASNGYVVYIWSTQAMTSGSNTISDWTGTNVAPTTFGSGSYGFGYSTNDTTLTGGTADRFSGPKYAGFIHDTSGGEPVADRTGPSAQEQNIITYRIAAGPTQAPGTYSTNIIYVFVPTY